MLVLLLLLRVEPALPTATVPEHSSQWMRRLALADADPAPCDAQCQDAQRRALSQLFAAWSGPAWTRRANWLSPDVPVCAWEGVVCCGGPTAEQGGGDAGGGEAACAGKGEGGVLGLSLAGNNLTGDVTAAVAWGALATLRVLEVDGNRLYGSLSRWCAAGGGGGLAALPRLRYLGLAANQLTGGLAEVAGWGGAGAGPASLPPQLGSGSVPAPPGPASSGARVPAAAALSAGARRSLAAGLGAAGGGPPVLTALLAAGNRLGGPLPVGLMRQPALQYLDLSGNSLTGPLPAELFAGAAANRLRSVRLAGNQLGGPLPELPEGADVAAELNHLDISRNRLEGPLPPYLARLASLSYLDASHNVLLSGPVAPLLRPLAPLLAALSTLMLRNNSLGGTLPAVLRGPQLQYLDLAFNNLTGNFPSTVIPQLHAAWSG
ncbi:Leucine-rich repeat receptor protein kinase EXS [Tetrabaena socialis]|uniref:Leucine-rich repeat receptor protein kinase EXS n=1 Tax=Tetrabaena socialis TaxID=47790 RepID=A0A2J7ZMV9_9CHLO|nr:Leucine-rich repeat receptor protein kinase EXS [Tetrabaena socialis]|eukprot:PNH01599.1 Leucine-rich repeat receptor protein kinase EXS [Tetrabaena socialis]